MPSQIRRSRRTKKINKKYTDDGWDRTTLDLLQDSDSPTSVDAEDVQVIAPSDEEFDGTRLQDDVEDELSEGHSVVSTPIATPQNSGDDASVASDAASDNEPTAEKELRLRQEVTYHSRGVQDVARKLGKSTQYQANFGPSLDDYKPMLEARDRWLLKSRDATFPSRRTVRAALASDWAPTDRSHPPGSEPARIDHIVALQQNQQTKQITTEEAQTADFIIESQAQSLVLGSLNHRSAYNLSPLEALNFGQAWQKDGPPNSLLDKLVIHAQTEENQADAGTATMEKSNPIDSTKSQGKDVYHEGWLLNVGEKVECLAWAPGQSDSEQYLAAVCRSTLKQRQTVPMTNFYEGPAFTGSHKYPACIQIWKFMSVKDTVHEVFKLDMTIRPQLSQVLCCKFGDIREMEWRSREIEPRQPGVLGDLVIISTDGCARMLHVSKQISQTSAPAYIVIEQPAICLQPPSGIVFTTCTLASSTDLIVGASDGAVRLFNIEQCSRSADPHPYDTIHLHPTYILKVSVAKQDGLSHFIATSSAASDILLTDLRAPYQDRIYLPRARLPTKNLIWSPQSQHWITTADPSGRTDVYKASGTRVVAHALRHFYTTFQLSRFPQDAGSATVLAGSVLHPYVLTGNSQGTIMCQNVLRKILPTGAYSRSGTWVQKLCEYEWMNLNRTDAGADTEISSNPTGLQQINSPVDASDPDDPAQEQSSHKNADGHGRSFDVYYGKDTRPGVSRFFEGFKVEKQDLANGITVTTAGKKKRAVRDKRRKKSKASVDTAVVPDADEGAEQGDDLDDGAGGGYVAEVVFEEEQAVTAIAWNENPESATWAAIGWGSGILRVQDLSHDAR